MSLKYIYTKKGQINNYICIHKDGENAFFLMR